MTTSVEYSYEDWRVLVEGPLRVAQAVMAAGRSSPAQLLQELLALETTIARMDQMGARNRVIRTVADALHEMELASDEKAQIEVEADGDADGGYGDALRRLREIAALVDQKSPAEEAAEFKRWLLVVGEIVAEAAKEGGFLGFGGVRVSEEEGQALRDVAAALGTTR